MLTREQRRQLIAAEERAILLVFCALIVCLIVAILAQMNVWQVAFVLVAFAAGASSACYLTALIAIDVEDDERRKERASRVSGGDASC